MLAQTEHLLGILERLAWIEVNPKRFYVLSQD